MIDNQKTTDLSTLQKVIDHHPKEIDEAHKLD
jgi:hypothetical protein